MKGILSLRISELLAVGLASSICWGTQWLYTIIPFSVFLWPTPSTTLSGSPSSITSRCTCSAYLPPSALFSSLSSPKTQARRSRGSASTGSPVNHHLAYSSSMFCYWVSACTQCASFEPESLKIHTSKPSRTSSTSTATWSSSQSVR